MKEIAECNNILDFLDYIERFPNTALSDMASEQSYTYPELVTEIKKISRKLLIKNGERVALYDNSPIDWIILFFAITIKGGIVVPIDNRVHPSFIKDALILTSPVLVVTNSKEKIPAGSYDILTMNDIKKTTDFLTPTTAIQPNDPLEIVFTSGTWSMPKGVTLSHRNIMANIRQLLAVHAFDISSNSLLVLPLSHAYAQMVGLFNPLSEGRHIVILNQINSITLPAAIKKYSIESIPVVPKILILLRNAILKKINSPIHKKSFLRLIKFSLLLPRNIRVILFHKVHKSIGKSLQTFTIGGAPLDKDVDDFFRGLGFELLIGYGLSECAPVVTVCLDKEREEGCVGPLLPGIDGFLDNNHELWIKGDNVFLGYWPDKRGDDFFCTNDIFQQNKKGEYILSGRTRNLILFPNGDKVFSEDIENIFRKLSGAEDVCAVNTEKDGQAYIICAIPEDQPISGLANDLRRKINTYLPQGIKIADIVILKKESYILTHTLKPNRKKIREEVLKLQQNKTDTNPAG